MKKSLLVLVMAVFMAASFGSAFAGPFSDVPKSHWAYEAVNNLAAKGLLEGYADGKFKGAKAMTRYEMALMVARLIDKKFGGADFDTLQKLTVEFADELALLGVKVQALEEEVKVVRNDVDALKSDVDMLKKGGMGKIKLTIEDRIRFEENKYKSLNAGVADIGNSRFVNRLRMNIKGNIDDNVSTFISLQDSTIHGTAIQNNPVNGGNNVTAADTNRDLYLGYIDIKNFGGEVIDNFRAGRMTLTIGKAFVFDN
ncbi:MAG TPA: S-layer homology domain-containing protein, partial [Candidatus Wallbacteria bacterium]|nr:S-layer homology domain-containing protein [Candidatus Wallbacteria bacterium]